MKDGLGTLSPAISKIRDSGCYTKSSSSRKQLFREAIEEANLKDQALPSVDVPTRWNSTFLMLKLAIPYRNAFKNLASNNANFTLNPTTKEWDEILMMKDFLEIFHKAMLGLGATRKPTAHLVFKYMKNINKHLNDVLESNPLHFLSIFKPMQEKFDKYWDRMKDFCAVNVVINPWCKLELLEFFLSNELDTSKVLSYVKIIRKNLVSWFDEHMKYLNQGNKASTSYNQDTANAQNPKKQVEDLEQERYKRFLAGKNNIPAGSKLTKLEFYFQEPTVPIDTPNFSILDWWKINQSWFPTLAMLAKTVLMAPMTSIASESAFSTGGRVLSDYRTRMKPNTLEALVWGQDWICSAEGLYPPKNKETIYEVDADEVVVIS
ncbi:hypothetical protein PCASD_05061 [Puccinia coronata f. sp. avenae]|uniref:HAT C-terminal dimerisation domain-containing protein n=1 Tax=Puccinia coronata f. sp. avenae TaxID=200324 RepID=A0A2N5VGH2_9BASI|nr:hypothetical protein PCASD_05061 [Puccinia coronata f. sp. avenae]